LFPFVSFIVISPFVQNIIRDWDLIRDLCGVYPPAGCVHNENSYRDTIHLICAGVHFERTDNQLTKSISTVLKVFVNGVEGFHRESNASTLLSPKVSSEDSTSTSSRWAQGEQLFK
jgi:hypothetical protein